MLNFFNNKEAEHVFDDVFIVNSEHIQCIIQYGNLVFWWPISGQCSNFIPPENIRQPKVFRWY